MRKGTDGQSKKADIRARGCPTAHIKDMPSKVGRPLKFKSVKDLEVRIEQYFVECDRQGKRYTVPGLALALGFSSRQSLLNYQGRKQFTDTVKRAKLRIEEQRNQELLNENNPAGKIFDLKNNFGWRDQQNLSVSGEEGGAPINTNVTNFPPQPKTIAEWEAQVAEAEQARKAREAKEKES